ncbi:MAG: hypothetical protein O2913_00315 [Chloroflexi bacterium]|nr:hypothetical protein [Chloroflexota bacterium]
MLKLTKVSGSTNVKTCKPTDGQVDVCSGAYGANGWLGLAGISVSGGHITKGYVKLNDTYFDDPTYNTTEWRNLVMCQEIGHEFGLGHQDEDLGNANLGSCIDYTSKPEINQYPNDHDYELLKEIYSHFDTGDTGGSGPPEGGGPPGRRNSEWGKAIGSDGEGRPNMFELDLGNGSKELTHVFWAN